MQKENWENDFNLILDWNWWNMESDMTEEMWVILIRTKWSHIHQSMSSPQLYKLNGQAGTRTSMKDTISGSNKINRNLDLVECNSIEVHGLTTLLGSPQVSQQYSCATYFDGAASTLLSAGFAAGDTRLALAPQAMTSNENISIQQAMAPGTVAINNSEESGTKLTAMCLSHLFGQFFRYLCANSKWS